MTKNEVKWGAILSYILIFANSIYGFILAPFILSTIGQSEYGVYKTIGSLTASLAVLDLGIGGTMQRYIAKFNALKDSRQASNYSAMGMIQTAVLSVILSIIVFGLFFTLDGIYGSSFTIQEMLRAKQIFIVLAINVALHLYENVLVGIISGYNKFVFSNTLKLSILIIRIILYCILLPLVRNSLLIVLITLGLEIITILIEFLYIRFGIKHRIKLFAWDKLLFKESFAYTALLFVQTIIIQFNGNVDNIVLGAVLGTTVVSIYSFALQIFNMYEQFSTAVSGVILPTVTNQVYAGADSKQLEKTVVKYGRIQWILLGAALAGFICCGQEFFLLWLGPEFKDCWYLALILMIPVTFPLIVNVCLAILKVKNLLKFRTISMAIGCGVNVIITVVGTHFYGYWAAAAGTAISTVIGSVILMNIYYKKKLGINILKVYLKIFNKTIFCILTASCICLVLNQFIFGTWVSFIIKVISFILVYLATLLMFGFSKEEKIAIRLKRGN